MAVGRWPDREFRLDVPDEEVVVAADVRLLARAIDTLLANAVLHGDGVVEARLAVGDVTIELQVRDHGSGFPEEALDGVAFERFRRFPSRHAGPGSGIGLAIVAKAARDHDGVATASNHPDGGACVTLAIARTSGGAP
jgi:signal transduction histidine kinase